MMIETRKNIEYIQRVRELNEIGDFKVFIRKAIECWEGYNNGCEERLPTKYSETTGEPLEYEWQLSSDSNMQRTVIVHPGFTTDFNDIQEGVKSEIEQIMERDLKILVEVKGKEYIIQPHKTGYNGYKVVAGIEVIDKPDYITLDVL